MTKLRLTASHFACPALLLAALFASGCGAQGYVPASTSAAQSAPGSFTVPAKVDVLLVEDDTGSMSEGCVIEYSAWTRWHSEDAYRPQTITPVRWGALGTRLKAHGMEDVWAALRVPADLPRASMLLGVG
jgi:hypothetical protein